VKKYRAAIVGLGRMGSTISDEVVGYPSFVLPYSIADSCRASERLELVAGADIDPAKREAFQERWGVTALYEDYLEMIAQEEPDLVAVCTRGELHAEMGVKVAEAGVPMLYLEKAMACSMREADAVREAVLEHGTVFNTGVLRRFDVRYQWARELIVKGEIGEPRVAIQYAGGSLLHGHIHSVDTIMYLLGDPRAIAVRGELRPRDTKIENNRLDHDPAAIYHIEFEGGTEGFTIPAGNHDYEVIGSGGMIKGLNNGADWTWRKPELIADKWTYFRPAEFPVKEPTSSVVSCLEDLVEAYETGRPSLGQVEVAHHATEICLAVAESHRRGGVRVELPLENRDLYVWHV